MTLDTAAIRARYEAAMTHRRLECLCSEASISTLITADIPALLAEVEAGRRVVEALPSLLRDYEGAIGALYHDEPIGQSYGAVRIALKAYDAVRAADREAS